MAAKKIPSFGGARLPNDLSVASGLLTYSQTFTVATLKHLPSRGHELDYGSARPLA